MKFSALAIAVIASVGQVEGAKLHSLQRAEAKAALSAMNEQMELLQQNMEEQSQSMAQMQSWWDTAGRDLKSVESWF